METQHLHWILQSAYHTITSALLPFPSSVNELIVEFDLFKLLMFWERLLAKTSLIVLQLVPSQGSILFYKSIAFVSRRRLPSGSLLV